MPESKERRVTFCIEATLYQIVRRQHQEGELSQYLRKLIVDDLVARDIITEDELREVLL